MNGAIIKYFIILYSFFFSTPLFAQMYGFKKYKIENGSRTIKILTLHKDKQGFIFAGTSNGLYKFDGISFSLVPFQNSIKNPAVTSIFEDALLHLWVGMQSGDIAQMINGSLQLFTPQEGTPRKSITALLEDKKNNKWFATDGEGIYYESNNHIYNINTDDGLIENNVYSIALAGNGDVIAGTDQGMSICKTTGSQKEVFNITSKNGLPDNFVKVIISAGHNYFWIGMQDKGVCLFDCYSKKFKNFPLLSSWKYGQVNGLQLSEKYLWIATEDSGLLKYDIENELLFREKITDENLLNINNVLSDNEGNVWILGNNTDLIKTSGDQLQILVKYKSGEYENIHAILSDQQNNTWAGITGGVIKYSYEGHKQKEQRFTIKELDFKTNITAIYSDKYERLWIGSMGKGIFLLEKNTGKYRKIDEDKLLVNSSVLSISGKGDSVFISTLEGAAVFEINGAGTINNKLRFTNFTNISNIGSSYIYDILKDSKNRVWFATDGRGITILDNNKFINYDEKAGLKDEVIYSITEDQEANIWFSTHRAGVYKYDGKKFTNYSLFEGLSDINISAVKASRTGEIYIIHKKGIDILDPVTRNIFYMNAGQGILEINVQDLGTVSKDTSGGILFSTPEGIIRFLPAVNKIHYPQTFIRNVELFLNPIDTNASHKFSYNNNSFTFSFIGLSYSDPTAVQYQYKLEGYNPGWVSTKDRSITFSRLPPGRYIFRVRSSVNQHFNNAKEASYTFFIKKPFWITWWFLITCALIITSLLFWYIRLRERNLKKVERLQQEKIKFQFETLRHQVNPHFLFNSFNTLISVIEQDAAVAVEYVEQLSDFFRNIVTYRDKDIIDLKEEIELLKTYLFIQQKRFGKYLGLIISLNEERNQVTFIPPLTLQLLAENAIKHNCISKETPLIIDIYVEDKMLVFRNNINPKMDEPAGAGMGLQNITNRYRLLSNKNIIIKKDAKSFIVMLPVLKQKI